MDHFYQNIHGWFDFQTLYTKMVEEHSTNSHFVEVGAFYGKSAAYMAVEIANSGKKKTLAEHTYNKRIERLIEIIELDLKLLD